MTKQVGKASPMLAARAVIALIDGSDFERVDLDNIEFVAEKPEGCLQTWATSRCAIAGFAVLGELSTVEDQVKGLERTFAELRRKGVRLPKPVDEPLIPSLRRDLKKYNKEISIVAEELKEKRVLSRQQIQQLLKDRKRPELN